jgi:hypothetical protein
LSHIVQIQTQVRDEAAVLAACQRLKLPAPVRGTFALYGGQVTGLAVQLPDWRYPVVCDTAGGNVQFDNFEGCWGDRCELDRFLQAYAVEKARLEARKRGYHMTEQVLPSGAIKLTIQTGGAA